METILDPLAVDFLADPYPFLAQQRDEAPVAYCAAIDMWLVTRHEDVEHVFLHPEIYSAANAQAPLMPLCDEAIAILKDGFHLQPTMSNFDPPGHTRIRRRLAKAFSTKRMRMLTPVIEARCASIIDGFADQRTADLAHELCYPLPALTIFTMIGFPDEDADRIKTWCSDKLVVNWGRPTPEAQVRAAETMVAFWRYCIGFVEHRRREPADDFTTDLMSNEDMSEPLTDNEIASILFGLSFAGHETTTNLAANCLRAVIENGWWAKLRADHSQIPNVIEETLRYDSSVVAWRRIAKTDTELGGAAIPAGAKIMLSIAAANRDSSVYDDPDRFDPGRAMPKDQLSFGKGIHLCLGAHLARIEIEIILRQMLVRFEGISLNNAAPLAFPPNIAFRGPISLQARLTAA